MTVLIVPVLYWFSFYNDTGLRRNTRYYYRIQAVNLFNDGLGPFPWSPVLNVRTTNR
jgi:hypothetical protein